MVVAGAKMAQHQSKLSQSIAENLVIELHQAEPVLSVKMYEMQLKEKKDKSYKNPTGQSFQDEIEKFYAQ
jgi:hypothetical protein